MKRFSLLLALLIATSPAPAWDGYDYDAGAYVEIEPGNLVREGQEVEFYDYESGEYKTGDVESITDTGSAVEVEVLDSVSGEYRTFEMEDD